MQLRSRQRGLGWFGFLIVGGLIGFFALLAVKVGPIYLNEMKIKSIVNKVANDPEQRRMEGDRLRGFMAQTWNIENPQYLEFKEIKIKRNERGRFLVYDYDAKENLFYNVFVVVHFSGEARLENVVN